MSRSKPVKRSGYIAIIGRPNAGKSTLLNDVIGTKVSIVTPKAQTTRERVLGILNDDKLGQVVFIDTPGVHRARVGGINEFMVEETREALEGPDLVWYLVDPSSKLEFEAPVLEMLEKAHAPVIVLLSKSDVVRDTEFKTAVQTLKTSIEADLKKRGVECLAALEISVRAGAGIKQLLDLSWERIPEGEMFYPDLDQVSDKPMRYFVAEKIREQLFMCLGEELPYSCAVEINSYQEPKKPTDITRITATINVERDSQKGMVIGKGGAKIKEIGQAARKEIEKFIDETGKTQVFLGLKVEVIKDWSKDSSALKKMGYNLPDKKTKHKRP